MFGYCNTYGCDSIIFIASHHSLSYLMTKINKYLIPFLNIRFCFYLTGIFYPTCNLLWSNWLTPASNRIAVFFLCIFFWEFKPSGYWYSLLKAKTHSWLDQILAWFEISILHSPYIFLSMVCAMSIGKPKSSE